MVQSSNAMLTCLLSKVWWQVNITLELWVFAEPPEACKGHAYPTNSLCMAAASQKLVINDYDCWYTLGTLMPCSLVIVSSSLLTTRNVDTIKISGCEWFPVHPGGHARKHLCTRQTKHHSPSERAPRHPGGDLMRTHACLVLAVRSIALTLLAACNTGWH